MLTVLAVAWPGFNRPDAEDLDPWTADYPHAAGRVVGQSRAGALQAVALVRHHTMIDHRDELAAVQADDLLAAASRHST